MKNTFKVYEKFMAMWSEKQTLWDVMFPLHLDKNEKHFKKKKFKKNVK